MTRANRSRSLLKENDLQRKSEEQIPNPGNGKYDSRRTVFRTKQIILFFFPPSDSDRDDTNSGSGSCKEDPDVCKYSLLKYMKSGIEWKRLWLYTRDVMVKMWTGFARSSDPTPANSGLPFTWTQHVSQTPLYLEITEHPGIPLSCSV